MHKIFRFKTNFIFFSLAGNFMFQFSILYAKIFVKQNMNINSHAIERLKLEIYACLLKLVETVMLCYVSVRVCVNKRVYAVDISLFVSPKQILF